MSLLSAFQSSLSVHKVWGLNCRVCHNKPLQAGRLKQDTCLRTVLEHRSRQWRFEETRTCWEIRGVSPLPFPLGVPRSPATNGLLQSLLSVTLSASTLTLTPVCLILKDVCNGFKIAWVIQRDLMSTLITLPQKTTLSRRPPFNLLHAVTGH